MVFPMERIFRSRAFVLRYRGTDRAARMRLLALCWIGVVLGFFTFSTTQEYYSMPAYPAFASLIGSAMAEAGDRGWRWGVRAVGTTAGCAFLVIAGLFGPAGAIPLRATFHRPCARTRGTIRSRLDTWET